MKKNIRLLLWLLPLLALLIGGSCGREMLQRHYGAGADTVIYIVRHAEKDPTPGLADPPLTPAGQQRAQALRKLLRPQLMLSAIFSTNTTRTRTTVQPLARRLKLPVETYDARQLQVLATRISREYYGRTVLIVGHSNTILETVEAFGAPRPVPAIGDDEYDYLLKVTIPRGSAKTATAVAEHYGAGR